MDNKKHNIYQSFIWVMCLVILSFIWSETVKYTNNNQVKVEQIRWKK